MGRRTGHYHGPHPAAPRDGDREQARQRINVEVRAGRRPHPNSLPCVDCAHEWRPGRRRHEYHHHLGYAPEHHLDVIPLCTKCHAKRDGSKAGTICCLRGHEYTPGNTILKADGTRCCRQCRRDRDRGRRDAVYWRAYRKKRKAAHG